MATMTAEDRAAVYSQLMMDISSERDSAKTLKVAKADILAAVAAVDQ